MESGTARHRKTVLHTEGTFGISHLFTQLLVKGLPAVWETQVHLLGQEDPLEKGMAIHSSILVWRIPWTEEPDGLQPMGSQSGMTE